MRHKEMAYWGAEDSEYEESSEYEGGYEGVGYEQDDELLAGSSDGTGEASFTQWEAIQEAFRQLRRF
jgi:hypothetical protein